MLSTISVKTQSFKNIKAKHAGCAGIISNFEILLFRGSKQFVISKLKSRGCFICFDYSNDTFPATNLLVTTAWLSLYVQISDLIWPLIFTKEQRLFRKIVITKW